MSIESYMEKLSFVNRSDFKYLIDTYGKDEVINYLKSIVVDYSLFDDDNSFYHYQLGLWEKYGYCFVSLGYYPYFNDIVNKLSKTSKYKNVDTSKQLTVYDEVLCGFKLLNKEYIPFLDSKGNLDIEMLLKYVNSDDDMRMVIDNLCSFYQNSSNLSSREKSNLACLVTKKKELNDNSACFIDSRLMNEIELYKEYRDAKNKLIYYNIRLVGYIANSYEENYNFNHDDYYQEGFFGLPRACDSFDIRKGYKFSTYATPWIHQFILRMYKESYGVIKFPMWIITLYNKLCSLNAIFYKKNGRYATIMEQAQMVNISPSLVQSIQRRFKYLKCTSIQSRKYINENDSISLEDVLLDDDSSFENSIINEIDYKIFYQIMSDILDERELEIVKMFYGLDDTDVYTQEVIANRMHVSRQRVKQIYDKAMDKLKNSYRIKKLNPYQ